MPPSNPGLMPENVSKRILLIEDGASPGKFEGRAGPVGRGAAERVANKKRQMRRGGAKSEIEWDVGKLDRSQGCWYMTKRVAVSYMT